MPRQLRLHVIGGCFYIFQRCHSHHLLFSESDDYRWFEGAVGEALLAHDARAIAYSGLPREIHLLVKTKQLSVAKVMKTLMRGLCHRIHRRDGVLCKFPFRYRSVLIEPETCLARTVRYIHLRHPQESAECASSHHHYCKSSNFPWLSKDELFEQLRYADGEGEASDVDDLARYVRLMETQPILREIQAFERCQDGKAQVLGSPMFMPRVRQRAHLDENTALDELTERAVARLRAKGFNVTADELRSTSRNRKLSLGRSMVVHEATVVNHIATLKEVAEYFNRSSASLSVALQTAQSTRPEYFNQSVAAALKPIMSSAAVESTLKQVFFERTRDPVSEDEEDEDSAPQKGRRRMRRRFGPTRRHDAM